MGKEQTSKEAESGNLLHLILIQNNPSDPGSKTTINSEKLFVAGGATSHKLGEPLPGAEDEEDLWIKSKKLRKNKNMGAISALCLVPNSCI